MKESNKKFVDILDEIKKGAKNRKISTKDYSEYISKYVSDEDKERFWRLIIEENYNWIIKSPNLGKCVLKQKNRIGTWKDSCTLLAYAVMRVTCDEDNEINLEHEKSTILEILNTIIQPKNGKENIQKICNFIRKNISPDYSANREQKRMDLMFGKYKVSLKLEL